MSTEAGAIHFAPNALGQSTQTRNANQSSIYYASGAEYFPNGALKQFTYGNGIVHTMTQNARQLPLRVTSSGGVNDFTYNYDANANITNIWDLGRGDNYSRWLTYDNLDRLTAAGSASFSGDAWHRFTYDAIDNIKSWKLAGVKDYADYVYDAQNRLTNIRNTAGASVVGIGYDPQGNLANKNGQAYDFDYGNRLRNVQGKEWYRYDGLGRRVQTTKFDASQTTLWQYGQAGQMLFSTDWEGPNYLNQKTHEYVYLAGSLIATIDHAWPSNAVIATKYQHTDALGSPVAVTNEVGAVIERNNYEPYGAIIGNPTRSGIGYTGHVMDGATGLTYMQQRYYDPSIGRFLSVDPVAARESGDNFNRHAYAFNNPYLFVDPDGRENQLGIIVTFRDFSRYEKPNAKDMKILNAAQRSVDLTVRAVMNGTDESRKADLKVWNVTADPDDVKGKDIANTIAYPASGDEPKYIDTVYTAKIADAAEPGDPMTFSDGITAEKGDPALLAVGAHELGHGSDGNMKINNKGQSERDVGRRVQDTIKTSPDVDRSKIK